jgi:hypothetical protein
MRARIRLWLSLSVVSLGCGGVAESALPPTKDAGVHDAASCQLATCEAMGANCGTAPDGCGGVLACGLCGGPQICGGGGPNRCGDKTCTPKTCGELGANCGTASDGCSKSLECGSCAAPQSCGGAGVVNQCGCTPTTCAAKAAACGDIDDGCGVQVHCGDCAAPQSCGGAGVANQCGCVPTTCAAKGAACGGVDDGCGATLSCGTCASPDVCGGAGVANQCGTPCDLIAKHAGWTVCKETATHCSGLYHDGAGCAAYCGAAGMVCKSRYGAHDTCQKETDYVIPCVEKNDHDSDWCECGYP